MGIRQLWMVDGSRLEHEDQVKMEREEKREMRRGIQGGQLKLRVG